MLLIIHIQQFSQISLSFLVLSGNERDGYQPETEIDNMFVSRQFQTGSKGAAKEGGEHGRLLGGAGNVLSMGICVYHIKIQFAVLKYQKPA